MFQAERYRLYPNKEQEILLAKHFGCVRFIYNHCLAVKKEAWETRKENLSRFDLQALIPAMKLREETAWLTEVNAQSLQSAVFNLDSAYSMFFKAKGAFPKFKNRHSRQSFQVPQRGEVGANYVQIPKVGKIKASISREVQGTVKTITISKTQTGKYFASILTDDGKEPPPKLVITEAGTVGIDLGLKTFATLSTGKKIANPRHLNKRLRVLRRRQRRLSKRKQGSNNRGKQRLRVARIHERVTNTRKDFLHKLTTRLVNENQVDSFAIEDLAVQNMVQNRRLAKSIGDAGWASFRRMLEYKAERKGKNVLVIGRFEPSSRACPCGQINHALKLSDRTWTCACGKTHDRDLNAALNIKCFALHPQSLRREAPESTPVETAVRRSVKQEFVPARA